MNRKTQRKNLVPRTLASVAFLALVCAAQADLKMNVVVSATDSSSVGIPKAGQYEVDFRPGQARIVQPNGTVKIFDFNASQIAVLDSNTKTYYVQPLSSVLEASTGAKLKASLALDPATPSQTKFGTNALKELIAVQSGGKAQPPKADASASTALPAISASSPISYTGSTWLADGSAVQASVGSVAPLVLIGAPQSLVSSITQTLDQQGSIPLTFSFGWINDAKENATLSMTVSAIDASTLDNAIFVTPTDYKEVQKPNSN